MTQVYLGLGLNAEERVYQTTKSYLENNKEGLRNLKHVVTKINMANLGLGQEEQYFHAYTPSSTIQGIVRAFNEVLPNVMLVIGDGLNSHNPDTFETLCSNLGYTEIQCNNVHFVNFNYRPEKYNLPSDIYSEGPPLDFAFIKESKAAHLMNVGKDVLFVNVAHPKNHDHLVFTGILKNFFGLVISYAHQDTNFKSLAHCVIEGLPKGWQYDISTRILHYNIYELIQKAAECGLLERSISIIDGKGGMQGKGPFAGDPVNGCDFSLVSDKVGGAFFGDYIAISLMDLHVNGKKVSFSDVYYLEMPRRNILPKHNEEVHKLIERGLTNRDSPKEGAITVLKEGLEQGLIVPCEFEPYDLEKKIRKIPPFDPYHRLPHQYAMSTDLLKTEKYRTQPSLDS